MTQQASQDGERTGWFSSSINPVRKGLYERDHRKSRFGPGQHPIRLSYWNGEFWGGWSIYPRGAFDIRNKASWEQSIPWRGLTRRAK